MYKKYSIFSFKRNVLSLKVYRSLYIYIPVSKNEEDAEVCKMITFS